MASDKTWGIIGYTSLIGIILLIISVHVYSNVSEGTWNSILLAIAIVTMIYGFYYPLRAVYIIVTKKFIPCFSRTIHISLLLWSGIFIGWLFPMLIVPYIICHAIGFLTNPE